MEQLFCGRLCNVLTDRWAFPVKSAKRISTVLKFGGTCTAGSGVYWFLLEKDLAA